MAYIYFNSSYAPCGFLIVKTGGDPYDDSQTCLIQTDWDYPGVASSMGWAPCECENSGSTDGTVDCSCGRKVSDMIASAYDFIEEHEGEEYEALNDYLR